MTIKQIEASIVEMAWNEGWIKPEPPREKTGKKVAVVGSGPAGLACAQQLARAGHSVTVYERADRIGGLLRYGIPDFKMEKRHLDRRLDADGSRKASNSSPKTNVGVDIPGWKLLDDFDAVCLCGGSTRPRDLPIEGRNFSGIEFAMDYLTGQNRRGAGDLIDEKQFISAHGKDVIIIGGGDTGADCLGTVHRHGCKSVHQFEIVPRPPDERSPANPWPQWSNIFRVSSAHEEGGQSRVSRSDQAVPGRERPCCALETVQVEMKTNNGRLNSSRSRARSGFIRRSSSCSRWASSGPEKNGLLEQLGVELDKAENVKADASKRTNIPKVFTAGDMTRGQSLIVWAIAEGRQAAHGIDLFLMGRSDLPSPLAHGSQLRPFA